MRRHKTKLVLINLRYLKTYEAWCTVTCSPTHLFQSQLCWFAVLYIVVMPEDIGVDVEFSNPLQIPIDISSICLSCEFIETAAGKADKHC